MIWLLFTLIIAVLGCIYTIFYRYEKRKLPKGAREAPTERGWPILGIMPNVERPIYHYLLKLGERHGGLMRIHFGMRRVYVLNNYAVIKKCLKEDGDNFSGRMKGGLIDVIARKSGVLLIDGERWALHRSFMVRVLRDFGVGKSKTTEIVQEECRHLLTEIGESEGKALDFSEVIPVYTVNIISKFLMSRRYHRDDKDFRYILQIVDDFTKKERKFDMLHFLFPIWDNSWFLTKISLFFSSEERKFEHIYEIFRREIRNHSKVLDLNSEGEDLLDRFLIEQSKIVEKTGSEKTFTEFQLIRSAFELFIAGFETTSTTLGWSLFFLSKYQEIQKNMHDEIVEMIGHDQMPSTNDKKSLPLTQAIMDEILRLSTVVPLSIVHRNFKDAIVDGIFIENNSLIFPNLYACHRDSKVWEKPFEFYPEHFLKKDDNGVLKYNPKEELIPFSIGKRQCLGESLARAEYFIFLSSIIQRYKVRFAVNVSEEEYQDALKANDGTIRFSKIKTFVFEQYE